jgi:hypothetical protein
MRLRQFDGNVAHSNDGDGLRVNGPKPDGTTEVTVNDPRAVPANPGSRELALNLVMTSFNPSDPGGGAARWVKLSIPGPTAPRR